MENWRQITHEAKDILTVCLAKAIDAAMTTQQGNCWFADFAEADGHQKVNNRITKTGQTSVRDLDLQALLKFLRYRNELTEQVLKHNHFFDGLDSFAAEAQMRQLYGLLDRLINDFRNRIEAHHRAADIEKELSGQSVDRIYGYEEAYQDMVKLAGVFSEVKDSHGNSYHSRLMALASKKNKLLTWIVGAVAAFALTVGLLLWLISTFQPDRQTPVLERGEVTVQLLDCYYEKDHSIVAVCYVNNGMPNQITDIHINQILLGTPDHVVATADFGVLPKITLDPGESIEWVFRFPENTVTDFEYNLKEAECGYKTSWKNLN